MDLSVILTAVAGAGVGACTMAVAAYLAKRRDTSPVAHVIIADTSLRTGATSTAHVAPIKWPLVELSVATSIELETGAGPLASIRRLPITTNPTLAPLPLNERISTGLQLLLQKAPTLLDAASRANTYVVRFAPEIARGLSDGTFSMMQAVGGGLRASALDSTGRIVGNATLTATSGAVTGVLVVWQVLAIVTAQKFLVDINDRLAGLERGPSEIKQWLDDEYCGKLEGNLRYMRAMADSLRLSDLTESDIRGFADQLETIGREAHQLMALQENQAEMLLGTIDSVALTGVGLSENSERAIQTVTAYGRSCERWWWAAHVRGLACQLRAPLPVSREVSLLRARELMAEMDAQDVRRAQFTERATRRVPELRGGLSFEKTDLLHQGRLKSEIARVDSELSLCMKPLSADIAKVEQCLLELVANRNRPIELLVEVDNSGMPTKVQRLLADGV